MAGDREVILLISGSLRSGSTNTAVLRLAATMLPKATLYDGMARLPHFNPDDDADPLPTEVVALRGAIGRADALLFCTPEYAGALPGSFKNQLDWTIGGGEIYEKPAAWINVSHRADAAHDELARVLGYAGVRVVEDACERILVAREDLDPVGAVTPVRIHAAVRGVCDRLVAATSTP